MPQAGDFHGEAKKHPTFQEAETTDVLIFIVTRRCPDECPYHYGKP